MTLIVAQEWHLVTMNTTILQGFPHPKSCAQKLAAATYSASAVERDTQFCFLEDQLTKDLPRNWQAPEVDFLSTLSLPNRNPSTQQAQSLIPSGTKGQKLGYESNIETLF
jgi:hypothetical protein